MGGIAFLEAKASRQDENSRSAKGWTYREAFGKGYRAARRHGGGCQGKRRRRTSMDRVIVVGAGKVGFHLAKALNSAEYEVVIVEKDEPRATLIAGKLDVKVHRGDGTDIWTLSDAGSAHAMYFVAATGSDSDNLVACQLAK